MANLNPKCKKAVGFNEGNLGRELHQLADSKLNTYMANLKKSPLLLQQLQTTQRMEREELRVSPDRVIDHFTSASMKKGK